MPITKSQVRKKTPDRKNKPHQKVGLVIRLIIKGLIHSYQLTFATRTKHTPDLLSLADHVINRGFNFIFATSGAHTLGRHGVKAIQCMGV